MVSDKSQKHLPPYVAYKTFHTFIEGLKSSGIPARIDRSYWGAHWSGSTGTQLVAALRFLGLVDSSGVPTPRLKQLVFAQGTQRTEILKQASSEGFDFLIRGTFDCSTATYGQLVEAFHNNFQVNNDVVRKCAKFFIGLAAESGIPLSSFITNRSKTIHTTSGTKSGKSSRKVLPRTNQNPQIPQEIGAIPGESSYQQMLLTKFPTFNPAWPDDIQRKWFEAYAELLKRSPGNGM
ncbi:MAG: DUF5343 domain-containing protein [Chloroflexi bacterium]|nr:DUF5343 domain-containing protein [Chloroflexota bacterium]